MRRRHDKLVAPVAPAAGNDEAPTFAHGLRTATDDKRLFVSFVTPGEGREDTRARIAMPEGGAMLAVVQTFAGTEARLIVTDEAAGKRSVEVSHEALIRHWEKLRKWVDEN